MPQLTHRNDHLFVSWGGSTSEQWFKVWRDGRVTWHCENDGPRVLRKGLEPIDRPSSLPELLGFLDRHAFPAERCATLKQAVITFLAEAVSAPPVARPAPPPVWGWVPAGPTLGRALEVEIWALAVPRGHVRTVATTAGVVAVRAYTSTLGPIALAEEVLILEGRELAEEWAAGQNAGHLHRFDAARWRGLSASERQVARLRRQGISIPAQGLSRGHAADLGVALEAVTAHELETFFGAPPVGSQPSSAR